MVSVQNPTTTVSLIDRPSEWERLEEEWRALFAASPAASPPLRWEWLTEWWRVYGPAYADPRGGLQILVVRHGEELIGALPLYFGHTAAGPIRLRRLGFLASGEAGFEETCSDYLDLLHAPGRESECVRALVPMLFGPRRLPWDELFLNGLSGHSPLLGLIDDGASTGGQVRTVSLGDCYLSNITGGFEEYLKRLSSETRKQARKLLRQAEGAGMAFEVATDERAAMSFFDEMVRLHRERWGKEGKSGCFAPRHEEFHRSVTRRLISQDEVVMGRLTWEGKTFAVLHGYRVGSKVDLYHQGVLHETHPVRSPGAVATLMLLRHLSEHGCDRLDHLAGANTFKLNYSTEGHPLAQLHAIHPSMRSRLWSAADFSGRAARKARRVLVDKVRRPSPASNHTPETAEAGAEKTGV